MFVQLSPKRSRSAASKSGSRSASPVPSTSSASRTRSAVRAGCPPRRPRARCLSARSRPPPPPRSRPPSSNSSKSARVRHRPPQRLGVVLPRETVALAEVLDHVRVVDGDVGRAPLEVLGDGIAAVGHHALDEDVGFAHGGLRFVDLSAPAPAATPPRTSSAQRRRAARSRARRAASAARPAPAPPRGGHRSPRRHGRTRGRSPRSARAALARHRHRRGRERGEDDGAEHDPDPRVHCFLLLEESRPYVCDLPGAALLQRATRGPSRVPGGAPSDPPPAIRVTPSTCRASSPRTGARAQTPRRRTAAGSRPASPARRRSGGATGTEHVREHERRPERLVREQKPGLPADAVVLRGGLGRTSVIGTQPSESTTALIREAEYQAIGGAIATE